MSITVNVFGEDESEECAAIEEKIPCGQPGIVEINAFARMVMGTWIVSAKSLCAKHARELRDALISELRDG